MKQDLEDCALVLTLHLVGRKWMVFILSELLTQGEVYFSEFLTHIQGKYGQTISARVLSDNLSLLEKNGIVSRNVSSDSQIKVHYSLTEKGEDLRVVFGVLKGWGSKWGGISKKKCQSFTCIHNGVPILDIEKARKLLSWNDGLRQFPLF